MLNDTLTAVAGLEGGHYTDRVNATGCTAILCRTGAVAGVEVRGGSPGTRETDLLQPMRRVERIHGLLLSGGSAFGLDAAAGVVRYLEEQGIGLRVGPALVPIVSAAILFDLGLITAAVRPDAAAGYAAALAAGPGPVAEGSVGAGTGATVGKALGLARAVKAGIGSAALNLPGNIAVAALVAVNAYGDVVDHRTGQMLAGPRRESGPGFVRTMDWLTGKESEDGRAAAEDAGPLSNTTIGIVATDAGLSKEEANFLARISHDGLALTIRPCHTMRDGDTMFALATGQTQTAASVDLTVLGAAAVEVTAQAVLQAVTTAEGLGGIPAVRELADE